MPEEKIRKEKQKSDVIIMANKPCCSADALRSIWQTDVNRITTGISMLDESIDEVKRLGRSDEHAIREALVKWMKIYHYSLPAAAEAYTDAMVREVRHAERKNVQGGACNDRREKTVTGENSMVRIEVLGMGCENCRRLMNNVEAAVGQRGIAAEIKKVEDIAAIMERGVMLLPGLIVDGELRGSGRVADMPEIKRILTGGI